MIKITDQHLKDYSALPPRVLQFGEGNFLRAFADFFIQKCNERSLFCGSVVMVKPTSSRPRLDFNAQDCRYTVLERGLENGSRTDRSTVVTSVSSYISAYDDADRLLRAASMSDISVIISNTTEAGIVYVKGERIEDFPSVSYPAKLCRLLYERFSRLGPGSGPLILPVELIENNGAVLKKCVLQYASDWRLGREFEEYVHKDCKFCSTLVDRIVTGFPQKDCKEIFEKLGYTDDLAVACEPYISWIIEGDESWKEIFPADKLFSSVKWVGDITPYRERKVKILNGAHTMSVLAAYLCGYKIVRDMMEDPDFSEFLERAVECEIIPTVDMDKTELSEFKNSVFERFRNPFIDHKLLDISLNSVSKYKARCLPSIFDYIEKFGSAPSLLSFSLAALIKFYNGSFDSKGDFVSFSSGEEYRIRDSKDILEAFLSAYRTDDPVFEIMKNKEIWGRDLTAAGDLYTKVHACFNDINDLGMRCALRKVLGHE